MQLARPGRAHPVVLRLGTGSIGRAHGGDGVERGVGGNQRRPVQMRLIQIGRTLRGVRRHALYNLRRRLLDLERAGQLRGAYAGDLDRDRTLRERGEQSGLRDGSGNGGSPLVDAQRRPGIGKLDYRGSGNGAEARLRQIRAGLDDEGSAPGVGKAKSRLDHAIDAGLELELVALDRIGRTSRDALLNTTGREFLILPCNRAIAGERWTALADARHVDIGQVVGLVDVPQLMNMMNGRTVRTMERIAGAHGSKLPIAQRGVTGAVNRMNSLNGDDLVGNQDDRPRTIRIVGRPKRLPTGVPGSGVVSLHANERCNTGIRDPALGRRHADGDGTGARQPGAVCEFESVGGTASRRTSRKDSALN